METQSLRASTVAVLVVELWLAGTCSGSDLVATQDSPDLSPLYSYVQSISEDVAIDAIGSTPLGAPYVTAYKVADFARELGEAGVEAESASLDGSLLLIGRQAALLKDMHARGVDLNADPAAKAAKTFLRGQMARLEDADHSDTVGASLLHVGLLVYKHKGYVVAKVGGVRALRAGVERVLEKVGLGRYAGAVGDFFLESEPVASALSYQGWRKLVERSQSGKHYGSDLTSAIVQAAISDIEQQQLDEAIGDVIGTRVRAAVADGLSVRLAVARAPVPVVLPAAPPAVVSTPVPAAVGTHPPGVAAVPVRVLRADPVSQAILAEDQTSRRTEQLFQTGSAQAIPEQTPPEQPQEPLRVNLHFKDDWSCAGAGNKPGCSNWDGKRNTSLRDQ